MSPPDDPTPENPYESPDAPQKRPRSKRDKLFSVEHEPALGGGNFDIDPAEHRAESVERPPDELEAMRDSITVEPALPSHADPEHWQQWLQQRRSQCTTAGNLAVTLLAAALSGPLAILGAFMAGRQTIIGGIYVIVFGPVVEELLKQSGMIYLLEKKPYRLFSAGQFVFAGAVSGLLFATIENLVYIHIYFRGAAVQNVEAVAAFRWLFCTLLHVSCSTIASLGLVRVWRRQLRDGRPADLSAALPLFALAMIIHGMYNLGAMFIRF